MARLVSILRAAHCRSTHHYFAIDALPRIATAGGQRLGQMLLKHHDEYLVGAKAPDKSFRDFKNHVIHVQDENWGGAPQACQKWFDETIDLLIAKKWKKAAFACGVLSHYFTDPLMPLHTAQSDRESVVHRPLEWSICQSYHALQAATLRGQAIDIELRHSDDWIAQAVIEGAHIANRCYNTIIDDYDLALGSKSPPDGLGPQSREALSEIIQLTINTWAKVLARIADESSVDIPDFSLTLTTLLATIDMPLAWVVRRISDSVEQAAVKRIVAEYERTGTVRRNLPAEIKHIALDRAKDRLQPNAIASRNTNTSANQPKEAIVKPPEFATTANAASPSPASENIMRANTASEWDPTPTQKPIDEHTNTPDPTSLVESDRVSRQSMLVDAPSIGPKTARRFEKLGIHTIGDFLDADPTRMCKGLEVRWITETLLHEWQDQAQLVCDVPSLCGYKAQLLVAADIRSRDALARSVPSALYQKISHVCRGIDGQRILRSSPPPSSSDVAEWISAALNQRSRAA